MMPAVQEMQAGANHPRAKWMALIAFLNFNITLGCLFGSFSVLLGAEQARLHVGPALSTLGIPAATLITALGAPLVGMLAARYPARRIMIAGALFSVAGYVLLGFAPSFPFYIAAFAALLGPGMAVAVVMPNTLVTRWYTANRGKALGFVCTPVVVALVPLLTAWVLQARGLRATELVLAGLSLVTVAANLFIAERPPGAAAESRAEAVSRSGMGALLRAPRFWGLTVAFIASSVSSIVITVHLVPMAHGWGLSAKLAATLLSVQSLAGIAGTNLFGWLADRLGPVPTTALAVFDGAVLWALLLIRPDYPVALLLIGLIGLHAAGIVPAFSAALSEIFGRESFSRAYGLAQLIILPFSVLCVPAAALAYAHTGSYASTIIAVAAFLALGSATAISARRAAKT